MVLYCGRTEEALNAVLDQVEDDPENFPLHRMLGESASQPTSSMPYRG